VVSATLKFLVAGNTVRSHMAREWRLRSANCYIRVTN